MYRYSPPEVFVHERIEHDERARRRADRMVASLDFTGEPVTVDDAALNEIAHDRGWDRMHGKRTGEFGLTGDPVLILNSFTWPTEGKRAAFTERYPALDGYYFSGGGAFTLRKGRKPPPRIGVCQDGYELHMAWGCLHRCDYCNIDGFLHMMMNVEEYVERLEPVTRENRWCKLWKFDNQTDIPAFEPEMGATAPLVDLFARTPGQYLMLYTKSANVDYLLDLDHQGKTLISWTLSCDPVTREIEKNSPTMDERIEAIAKCQAAGYHVRVRMSPIFPIRNWREENARMFDRLFGTARVNLVTIDMFKHIDPSDARRIFDLSHWDDEFAGYIDEYAAMPREERPASVIPHGKQCFPHEARKRVYEFFIEGIRRHSPHTRIAFCGETPDMWRDMAPVLGMTEDNYVCACGPTSVPGHPLLPDVEEL